MGQSSQRRTSDDHDRTRRSLDKARQNPALQQLLDRSRKDAAERYLADSLLSISEVAHEIGYSEPAAFNRAFRRWHHQTPQAFRCAAAHFRSTAI
jgi:AraC-like DNA-binding protein